MPVSHAFIDMVREALVPLGNISVRRMFGGAGLYCDGVMFALIEDDTLYLKADAGSEPRFKAEGSTPFAFEGQTRMVETSYWRVPDRLYDEPDDLLDFAREALFIASRLKLAKRKAGRMQSGEAPSARPTRGARGVPGPTSSKPQNSTKSRR